MLFGLYCTGGSANAFNQYFERNIDSQMERTKTKRPLADKRLNENYALIFTLILGLTGISLFTFYFNILSGMLSLATIIFYSFYYTLYLKPRTPQNIVIGGAAGAMGPVIAWGCLYRFSCKYCSLVNFCDYIFLDATTFLGTGSLSKRGL